MYPILFSIGKINFYTYGLFAATSAVAFYYVVAKLAKIKKLKTEDLFEKVIITFLAGIIGARIAYFIIYNNQFYNWYEIFYIWNGGLVSYGGIIGAIAVLLFLFKDNLKKWFDILIIGFLLGSSIWRIGGFFSGGNPGEISLFHIPMSTVIVESIITFCGFLLFYNIYKKNEFPDGVIFWICFGFYGIIRVAMDYFRDYDFSIGVLKSGQFIGFLIFIISIIAICYIFIYDKKYKKIYLNIAIFTVILIGICQITRFLISKYYPNIIIQNSAVFFGTIHNVIAKNIFITIGVIALILLIIAIQAKNTLSQIAIALILSGTISNIIDRLVFGYVVDYANMPKPLSWWPTFNLPDVFLLLGIILYAYQIFRHK